MKKHSEVEKNQNYTNEKELEIYKHKQELQMDLASLILLINESYKTNFMNLMRLTLYLQRILLMNESYNANFMLTRNPTRLPERLK